MDANLVKVLNFDANKFLTVRLKSQSFTQVYRIESLDCFLHDANG